MTRHGKNRTIENPLIGDRVTFLSTSMETDGKYELVEVELNPGRGNDLHYHTAYSEEFQALVGEIFVDCDGKRFVLKPGDKMTVQTGSLHRFYNPGSTSVTFRVKICPARNFQPMLRIAYGLIRDGKTNRKGIPRNILEMAVIFHIGESYLPGPPLFLQKGLFGLFYLIAKCSGVKKRLYLRYCPDN